MLLRSGCTRYYWIKALHVVDAARKIGLCLMLKKDVKGLLLLNEYVTLRNP